MCKEWRHILFCQMANQNWGLKSSYLNLRYILCQLVKRLIKGCFVWGIKQDILDYLKNVKLYLNNNEGGVDKKYSNLMRWMKPAGMQCRKYSILTTRAVRGMPSLFLSSGSNMPNWIASSRFLSAIIGNGNFCVASFPL